MLSRNLVSAAVVLLTACLASPAGAQNLEAGKTPSQIFSQTCSLCHKSSRGLLKTVPAGSLAGFLRQHYTTSTDMASMLSAYVLSNGATDTRLGGDNLTKQGKEARSGPGPEPKPSEGRSSENKPLAAEGRPEPKPDRRTREASRPDVDGLENIPGVARPAGGELVPSEAQQKGKKPKADRQKPPASTASQEPNVQPPVVAPPVAGTKTEPAGGRPDSVAITPIPGALVPPQKTAEEKSANMPVFNLEPPQAEVVPAAPPRPPAGPPVVPISE